MKKIKEYIGKLLFKTDKEIIEHLMQEILETKQQEEKNIEKKKKELKDEQDKLNKRKKELDIREKIAYQELFKELLEEQKEVLNKIRYFNLIPGNKVWIICGFSGKVEEVEIEYVHITKDKIYYNDLLSRDIFKTKKEAIKAYNKYLEDSKIK